MPSMGFVVNALKSGIKIPFIFLDSVTALRLSKIVDTYTSSEISPELPLLFYIHYSRDDTLTPREIATLSAIQGAGFQTCLVINSDKPSLEKFNLIKNLYQNLTCVQILRKNQGFDLTGYRDSYNFLASQVKSDFSSVIFMNNSLLWFPSLIKDYLERFLATDADVVAGSISNQYQKHIQTFMFGSLTSSGLRELEIWLKTIKNWRLKRTVVSFGEIATSKLFRKGVRIAAYPNSELMLEASLKKIHDSFVLGSGIVPYSTAQRLISNRAFTFNGIPTNPTHSNWLELLENGFPGVKIDLIRSNSTNIPDYEVLISYLLEHGVNFDEISRIISTNKRKYMKYRIRSFIKI